MLKKLVITAAVLFVASIVSGVLIGDYISEEVQKVIEANENVR